jgi:hypothetical protein
MFQHNAERLLRLIERVYRWLPLGTVVNNKVLVVHGGISDITDLDWVRNLDRHKVRFSHQLPDIIKRREVLSASPAQTASASHCSRESYDGACSGIQPILFAFPQM